MKFESALLAALVLVGCFPLSDERSPTAPTPPSETPNPPPVLPPSTSPTSSVWVMVISESGSCIDGSTVEIVRGQGLGQKLTQKADCDYWGYGGGITFTGLMPRVELTLRASAVGRLAEEKTIAPAAGPIGPIFFAPDRIP